MSRGARGRAPSVNGRNRQGPPCAGRRRGPPPWSTSTRGTWTRRSGASCLRAHRRYAPPGAGPRCRTPARDRPAPPPLPADRGDAFAPDAPGDEDPRLRDVLLPTEAQPLAEEDLLELL